MSRKVLVLGGYGNFGGRISRALAGDGIEIVIAGRHRDRADALAGELRGEFAGARIETASIDVTRDMVYRLGRIRPAVVVNTCGPFQGRDYAVAEACIERGVHYVDLADARDFVTGITALDRRAKARKVLVVSGASTVPGLSSAVLEHFRDRFSSIETLRFGIAPGQKSPRGLATTQAILSYVGKPLAPHFGTTKRSFGWQNLYRQEYPGLGKRWMANCDIPDLDLLPERYGIASLRFSAGMELGVVHLGLWALSWAVRLGLPLDLPARAEFLLRAANWFDRFGSESGGMHMVMTGTDKKGRAARIKWFIIANDNDGPQIPCVPSLVLAKRLAAGKLKKTGAVPCVGLVSLEDYMAELKDFSVRQHSEI